MKGSPVRSANVDPTPPKRSAVRAASLALAVTSFSLVFAPSSARADDPPKSDDQHFRVDPISDGVLIVAGLGFSSLSELIISTGEIAPQRPGSTNNLLGFDRLAISQTIDPNASTYSTVGLG